MYIRTNENTTLACQHAIDRKKKNNMDGVRKDGDTTGMMHGAIVMTFVP